MATFNLLPNESLILKSDRVCHSGTFAAYTDDLYLTDQAIILVCKGLFGNIKNVQRYPLSQIKIYNGKPQAVLGKAQNGLPKLDVYLTNGIESFEFQTNAKKQVAEWIDAIYEAVTGQKASSFKEDEDDDDYDGTLLGVFKEISRDVIGIKPKKTAPVIERITKKCVSCSAPLSGNKGEMVHCKYCDTDQVL